MQQSTEKATTGTSDGSEGDESGINYLMEELKYSIPSIDEAMSFADIMNQVQVLDYNVVVFNTTPTGHTICLLSLPTILEKALGKVM